ncbi:hypothetical protein BHM03_00022597 [Ensete ventricosum]|nr:hypothetical protein BHM03_00022597 [Ensete ventricosum]
MGPRGPQSLSRRERPASLGTGLRQCGCQPGRRSVSLHGRGRRVGSDSTGKGGMYKVAGTQTARYLAVLPKIDRQQPIKGEIDHSSVMGLAAPWYRRGGISVESSIPCSHGGRALVVKGTVEVENAEANSKYQDKDEG